MLADKMFRTRTRFLLLALILGTVNGRDGTLCEDVRTVCSCSSRGMVCTSVEEAAEALAVLRRHPERTLEGNFMCIDCQLEGDLKLGISVSDVNISSNRITAFQAGSSFIKNLDVSRNQLTSLSFGRHFPSLRRLYASNNRIEQLTRLPLNYLAVLDLSNNKISNISGDAFNDLRDLTVLNLNGNQVSHLLYDWFASLKNLERLSFAHNQLTELNNLIFLPTPRLQFIDVSHNSISHVGMLSFQSLLQLKHLDLSYNNLASLPGEFCKSFVSLQFLDVSMNPLLSLVNFRLPAKNFSLVAKSMFALKTIRRNDTLGLGGIVSLDLSDSRLETIEASAFEKLVHLQFLNLSHCSLTSLPRGLFLPLVSLNRVNLQGNFWHCDCGLKWLLFFFFHRPQLQLEGPGLTHCSTETSAESRVRLPREERLLDFLDHRVLCSNATVTNYTEKAHFRLGSTAVLVCDVEGVPKPSLDWHTLKSGMVDHCGTSCFKGSSCSGCRLARWTCKQQEKVCDNDDCRGYSQECLNLVEHEQIEGQCCSSVHLKSAVETCYSDVVKDPEQCLTEVGTLSLSNFSLTDISACVQTEQACLTNCLNELCNDESREKCVESAVSCALDVLGRRAIEDNVERHKWCRNRICARSNRLYISKVTRGDSGYYICRTSNVLQTQEVTIHLTLDYDFLMDVKNYSILAGLGLAIIFTIATLIGVGVEKILQHFGLKCPCDADGPIRRQNIVKILEQIESYRRQNLERLRENYNWQVARIKENCILQMDKVKDCYIAEQTGKIRDYGSSQIGAMKDNYIGQVQRVRDYGNSQMDWLRENYVFQRNRIHKFSKHQLIRLRENYKLQQKHLNKILETLPNLESCRKGFYSETDLVELNFTAMLVPPPPPPESVLEFPTFDEFSLPDIHTAFESRSGTILSPDDRSMISGQSDRRSRKAYPTIEQVIRERLLPLGEGGMPHIPSDSEKKKRGHRRSYSAPITQLNQYEFRSNLTNNQPTPLKEAPKEEQRSPEKSPSENEDSRTEGSMSTAKVSEVRFDEPSSSDAYTVPSASSKQTDL